MVSTFYNPVLGKVSKVNNTQSEVLITLDGDTEVYVVSIPKTKRYPFIRGMTEIELQLGCSFAFDIEPSPMLEFLQSKKPTLLLRSPFINLVSSRSY